VTVVVTDEMIEAGLSVLDLVPVIQGDDDLVRAIYEAMAAAAPKGKQRDE
jgi:hypothetical protein